MKFSTVSKIMTNRTVIMLAAIAIMALIFAVLPETALANGATGSEIDLIEDYDAASEESLLGTATPIEIAGALISAFLGILGLIALVLIIYSGWTWMTAAGNKEKVEEAQDRMRNATIGLAIILASYSITLFIFSQLEQVTCFGAQCNTSQIDDRDIEPLVRNDYA